MPPPVHMIKEWYGSPVPSHITVPLPSAAQLVKLCTATPKEVGYTASIAYPEDASVYWIKSATSLVWNEMAAQKMAYDGLRSLASSVRAPAVYYGCKLTIPLESNPEESVAWKTYIVSEYVSGKTAAERLDDDATTDEQKDAIYKSIAYALSELCRIPIAAEKHFPASASGAKVRHPFFDDNQAPLHYRDINELERHLNEFLIVVKKEPARISQLEKEPVIFCYSDIWLGNFIIDDNDNITVVGFEDASILPASFFQHVVRGSQGKINRDITSMVTIPQTEGIDNTVTLQRMRYWMVMMHAGFARVGQKLLGDYNMEYDDDECKVDKVVKDEQGNPVFSLIESRKRPPVVSTKPSYVIELPPFRAIVGGKEVVFERPVPLAYFAVDQSLEDK